MFDIFSLPDFKMPDGFLWGAGYAGHQVEGNNIHSQNWDSSQYLQPFCTQHHVNLPTHNIHPS